MAGRVKRAHPLAPKPAVPAPISDRTWQGQQSWNREVIKEISGRKVRLRVKKDAYDFQSWGKAEVWKDDEWSTVHTIPGQRLKVRVSYVSLDVPPTVFDDDLGELERVARAVLT